MDRWPRHLPATTHPTQTLTCYDPIPTRPKQTMTVILSLAAFLILAYLIAETLERLRK